MAFSHMTLGNWKHAKIIGYSHAVTFSATFPVNRFSNVSVGIAMTVHPSPEIRTPELIKGF
jgi:hypothetical protein